VKEVGRPSGRRGYREFCKKELQAHIVEDKDLGIDRKLYIHMAITFILRF
jgi:hypothetical protein